MIRVTEDVFAPGEVLSFRANGLGGIFEIETELDEEDHYTPAYFDLAPGDEHYGIVLAAAMLAEARER